MSPFDKTLSIILIIIIIVVLFCVQTSIETSSIISYTNIQNVTSERCSWIGALVDDITRGGFDCKPVGRETGVPVWLAERAI
jgi:hypothetical protein